jgi:hypothetical protein
MPVISKEQVQQYKQFTQAQATQTGGQQYAPPPGQAGQAYDPTVSPLTPDKENWDYKTSPVNLQGDLLPEGAQSWTPHGTPYFGQGIGGTLKKYAWMLTGDNPNKLVEKFNAFTKDTSGETGGALVDELKNQALRFLTPNEASKADDWKKWQDLEKQARAVKDTDTAHMSIEEKEAAKAAGAQLWKNLEGTSILSPVLKTAKVGLNVVMDVFSEAAIKFEQIQSAGLAMGDYVEAQGGQSLQLDDSAAMADERQRGINRGLNIVRNVIAPVLQGVDTFKFVLAPGTWEEKKEVFKTGWDAGKMLYSQTVTPSILEEYKRRAAAGEDPQLLAEELQNPWAEAGGQLILDPLNVVGFLAKSAKLADVAGDASKLTRTVEEMAGLADDLADIAKAPVGEARAVGQMNKIDEGVQAALKASDKRVTLQYGKGSEFTTSGYRKHWSKKVKSTTMLFTQTIMRNGGKPDDLADFVHHGSQLRSTDKATRLAALDGYMELANKFKMGRTAFSEMALDTWNLVGKLAEGNGDNILLMLQKSKGDPAKLAELAGKLMDKAVTYAAPEFEDLQKAAQAVKGGTGTARDIELAAKLENVSPTARKLLEINAGKVGEFKRKTNDILSRFYFGTYGPGVRNAMGNATHMIVDRGIGGTVSSYFRDGKYWSLADIEGQLKNFFGGQLPPDLLGLSLLEDVGGSTKTVLGIIPAPNEKILGILPTPGKFMDDTEKAFATRIYWSNFRDTFDKIMQPGAALPNVKTFKDAGMTENQIRDFVHIVRTQTFGDVEKAIIKYGEKHAEGGLDAWRAWSGFVDNKQMAGLREVGMEQEINAIADMTDASPQKIQAEFARLRRSIEERAKLANLDPKAVSSAREEFSFLNDLGKAVDSGHLDGDGLGQLNQRLETAANAQDEAMQALGSVRDRVTDPALREQFGVIEQVGSEARKMAVRNKTTGLTTTAWDMTKKIKKGTTQAEIQRMWDASVMAGTPLPSSAEEILSTLWQGTRFSVAQAWEKHFADNFSQLTPLIENLKAADPSLAGLFQKADKASAEAQQMRSAIFHNNHIYVQPPARTISEVASRYKIPTATESGAPMWQRLANTLKKEGLEIDAKTLASANNDPELIQTIEDVLKNRKPVEKVKTAKTAQATTQAPNIMEKATDVPRSELPDEVSSRFADEANRLLDELSGGQVEKGALGQRLGSSNVEWYKEINAQKKLQKPELTKALEKIVMDKGKDKGVNVERMKELILDNFTYGDEASGTPPDLKVLQELGAPPETMQKALDAFNDITKQDLTLDEALEAFTEELSIEQKVAKGDLVEIAPKYIDDAPPSDGRVWLEGRQGYLDTLNSLEKRMLDNYGLKAVDKLDNKTLKNLKRTLLTDKDSNGLTAADRITEGIAMSDRVGKHWRDFGLLPYGETRNFDLMASYAFPYQFWYSRSYKNWMTRLATDPQVISNYARLKDTMAKENMDSPEWWRYNVTVPSHFLGLPIDNPMSFNIEANIWPLYGLTGVDFNDATKRADWWSATIDDMGKFGPSTWAPISWAVAGIYAAKGEQDVAARWANRLVPQTKIVRNISSKFGQPIEIDPLTHLFSGGIDPYERNRVGRILGQYAQDGVLPDGTPITEEELIEVARTQEGPIWDMAIRDAVQLRAGGEIFASFMGVGFKARPPEDQEIDKFYQDYHRLMSLSNAKLLSPEKIRESYDLLRDRYPFMDTVLLARKAGEDRERAYSYNILSRVPPGQANDLYKIVDIDPETAQKFYDNGGDLSFMDEAEQKKFMAGMINIGALLEIPELATKQEWNAARNEYGAMKDMVTQQFGEDVYDKMEYLYTLSGAEKDAYRDAHPELDAARSFENEYITSNPLLYEYYGGIETLQQYYNGKMYEELDKQFGDVQPIFDEYYNLQLTDPTAAKRFKKQHPEMDAYNDAKKAMKQNSLAALVDFAADLPEGAELGVREGFTPVNPDQEQLANYANQQPATAQDYEQALGAPLMNIVSQYYADLMSDPNKAKLAYQASRELDYRAKDFGYNDGDDLLRAILLSLQGVQQ